MRPRRFDTQLQSVFMVLSGLMIVVGLASIGVNRFLAQSQQRILAESIAIIERTERVALDADLATSMAAQLALADTAASADEMAARLTQRIDRIEEDTAAMRQFLQAGPDAGDEAGEARALVRRIGQTVGRVIRLDAALRQDRERLEDAAQRLTDLISTETDLVRLRITAGIWELYAQPAGPGTRPGLDRLADVDVFALERLGELKEASATLTRLLPRISDARVGDDLPAIRAEFGEALSLARDRTRFLATSRARSRAATELDVLAGAAAANGLMDLKASSVATRSGLTQLAAGLGDRLDVLSLAALRGRTETRGLMRDRIASAGRHATLLTAALAGIVLSALLSGYLVWGRTRATVVHRLGAVARRIVEVAQGDPGRPMPISGHDEIGRLEKALNVLRRRAEESARLRRSLEAAVLARTADVVAEMHASNAARAKAEELSRAKTHFLARMSHEIRTPLNGVIGLLDILATGEKDAARRAHLETALTSARDLQVMTEDILSFSSHEDGQIGDRRTGFDPARLARGLGDHLEMLARPKGLRPVVQIAPDLPPALTGVATQIRQVVMNLLANAVKYTDAGEVRLIVSHRAAPASPDLHEPDLHEIVFAVVDTGPGMTPEEMRQAFDIYGRSVDARRRGVPGVGLGLAIVRQLTDAMGGELRVNSSPGMGSSFALVLTLPESDAAGLSDAPDLSPHHAGRRVLVIDDHPVNRLVARGYLERMGCSVAEAATGSEALAQASAGRFDAILIDLDLPDMRGEEVAARIDRKGARLAVLTADLVQDDPETRQRFGVDHVLTKPVAPRALAAILSGERAGDGPVPDPLHAGLDAVLQDDIANLGADATVEIVAAFLSDLTEAVPTLLSTADDERRRKLAHRLKGAAGNFGLEDLCALLQRIQSGDDTALPSLAGAADRAALGLAAAAVRAGLPLQPAARAKQ